MQQALWFLKCRDMHLVFEVEEETETFVALM